MPQGDSATLLLFPMGPCHPCRQFCGKDMGEDPGFSAEPPNCLVASACAARMAPGGDTWLRQPMRDPDRLQQSRARP